MINDIKLLFRRDYDSNTPYPAFTLRPTLSGPIPQNIVIGLFLAKEIPGVFSGDPQLNEKATEVSSFRINEQILTLKPETVWDEYVRAHTTVEEAPKPESRTSQQTPKVAAKQTSAASRWKAGITLGVAVLALVAAWLVVPEFRKWTGLDKPEVPNHLEKKSISGIVVDVDTNQGIGQAAINLVGRTEQYTTEDSGNFRIDLPSDSPVRLRLRVSKSGFQPLDTSVEPPVDNLVLTLRKQ